MDITTHLNFNFLNNWMLEIDKLNYLYMLFLNIMPNGPRNGCSTNDMSRIIVSHKINHNKDENTDFIG